MKLQQQEAELQMYSSSSSNVHHQCCYVVILVAGGTSHSQHCVFVEYRAKQSVNNIVVQWGPTDTIVLAKLHDYGAVYLPFLPFPTLT